MSTPVKAMLAVALIVPLVAYVAGSLAASGADTPDRQGPVIINDVVPTTSTPTPTPSTPSPTRDNAPQKERPENDDVRVVTPTPKPIDDDDDDDERDERDDASDDSRDDTDDGDDTDD
jgi:hypothetical protein